MADSLEDFTDEQRNQMAATYKSLLDNPETREFALRATKKVNPGISIPEIDIKDQTRAAFAREAEERGKLEEKLRERDARDRINSERQALRDAGHSSDDVAAIEKIMTEKHIPSYATAAEFYRGQQTIAQPTPHVPGNGARTYQMPANAFESLKQGKNGLRDFARNESSAALDDLRSGRIKLH